MPTLLTFGDSNTYGTLPIVIEGEMKRLAANSRWPGVTLARLGPQWQLIEEGLPGRTTRHADPDMGAHLNGETGLRIALESHGPIDYLTLMLGTNDLKLQFNRNAEQIADDVGVLLDIALSEEMRTRHGGFAILLICPPPILELGVIADKFIGGRAKSLMLSKAYTAIAKARDLPVLDCAEIIESSPLDGIHYEPEMHRKLGIAVADSLARMSAIA